MSVRELNDKLRKREQRRLHVRKTLSGTPEKPRMTVFKSNRYLYVQVIDDAAGATLATASTLEESLKGIKRSVEGAAKLGEEIGKRLKEKSVSTVVFDRNGYKYHGIVKAIADGARKAGIAF
ncbi:MAG TPA: 50S ribosomal protein L18 [Rectinemataceae bacterium]|nr:50S ribosomal protein L18 [Rectinemataceae bacterium]